MFAPVYLDSNAVIRFVESLEQEILALFERARVEGFRLVTSELTLAETLVIPWRRGDRKLTSAYENLLQGNEFLQVVPVDRTILRRSAQLRAEFGGKGMDAIHCATAMLSGCKIVVSSDRRFRTPPGIVRIDIDAASKWEDLI